MSKQTTRALGRASWRWAAAFCACLALALSLPHAPAAWAADALAAGGAPSASAIEQQAAKPKRAPIRKAKVREIARQRYTGRAVKPKLAVTYRGRRLVAGRDYRVAYRNNVKPGTAKAIVKGKGDYRGKKVVRFKIWSKGGKRWVEKTSRVKTGSHYEKVEVSPAYDAVVPAVEQREIRWMLGNGKVCWSVAGEEEVLYTRYEQRRFEEPVLVSEEGDRRVWACEALDASVATLTLPKQLKDRGVSWFGLLTQCDSCNYDSTMAAASLVGERPAYPGTITEDELASQPAVVELAKALEPMMPAIKEIDGRAKASVGPGEMWGHWGTAVTLIATGNNKTAHHGAVYEERKVDDYDTVTTGRWA